MGFDTGGGGGAPTDAAYLVASADPDLSNETVVTNPENVPAWTEDANSPIDGTGAQSHSVTLSGIYDVVFVLVQVIQNDSGGAQAFGCQVNGDTGANYRFSSTDGTSTSSANMWDFNTGGTQPDGTAISGSFIIVDRPNGLGIVGPIGESTHGETLTMGGNFNVTQPLDSITLRGGSGNITAKARVLGWSGGL